jgi:hypothetical protein
MPWGRRAERRPWLGIAVRFVLAARHGWRAVLRVPRWPVLYAQRPNTRRFGSPPGSTTEPVWADGAPVPRIALPGGADDSGVRVIPARLVGPGYEGTTKRPANRSAAFCFRRCENKLVAQQ